MTAARVVLVASAVVVAGIALAPAAHAAPAVTVLPATSGLDPAGQPLTVRGAGFNRDANGGVGIYVVFGPKGDDYSTNADRYQAAKWVRSSALGGSGASELRADGTFEVTLPDLKARYEDGNGELVDCYVVDCLVMTFTAHGIPDRSHDTFTRVTFATGKPAPVGKALVPYRPRKPAAPTRPAATRATTPSPARRAAGRPTATAHPTAAAPSTPASATAAAAPSTPAAGHGLAAPVPLRGSGGTGLGTVAGVVVAGAGAGAAVTVAARRRLRRVSR